MANPQPRGPGVWRLRTDAPPDPHTSARRQLTRTFHGTRKEALNAQRAFEVEIHGIRTSDTRTTFNLLLDKYLDHAKGRIEPRTWQGEERHARLYLRPHLGDIPLCDLKPAHFDDLYLALQKPGAGARVSRLAPATIRRVHITAVSALSQAVRWEWITRNPAHLATPPVIHRTEPWAPEHGDVVALLDYLETHDPELYLFVELTATIGARPGETCALRIRDVDLSVGIITIEGSIAYGKDLGRYRKSTKTNRVRKVAIDDHLTRLLEKLVSGFGEGSDERYLFSNVDRRTVPWRPDSVSIRLLDRRREAGVKEPITLRSLRHFVATQLIGAGVDVRTVAGRLGHASPNLTLNTYASFLPEKDREAADVLRGLRDKK